ncbi:MAG: hypothetical protein GY739_15995 [Mesoflavibacter sp.]|nr:hypothetical protein [Mesoflavibacter sp.]
MKQLEPVTLNTGVKITFDKKGNIKTLHSPYYAQKKDNPYRGGILRYAAYLLKKVI